VTRDVDVWKQICAGDLNAFNAFYHAQAPRLHAFAKRMTGDVQAAEDIVQETFTEFWKRPERYDPELGTLRNWLFGISRKYISDWWRKRERATA